MKAVGLAETLKGKGPFTVFVLTNDAFENLPLGTVNNLLKPESKATLTKVLTYHVVEGKYTYNDLKDLIKKSAGKAVFKTVARGNLTISMNGDVSIVVTEKSCNMANISTYDVLQSKGVIQVIDKVLMPKM